MRMVYRGRNHNHRPSHPKITVWSHTLKAEIEYFLQFKHHLATPLLVAKKKVCYTPTELIEKVIEWMSNQDNYHEADGDQVWCIFDVDDFYKSNKKLMLETIDKAEKYGIKIAYSNQCFELWVLLHFDAPTAPIQRGNSLAKKIQEHFSKNKLGKFEKNMNVFGILLPFQDQAIKNSKKIYPKTGKVCWSKLLDESGNPSTNIHILIEEIRKLPY